METKKLLNAGIIGGPLFVIGSIIHGLLRPGFNMVRHPASLLLLGDLGWIQVTIFVSSGLLLICGGVGLKRILTPGIGSRFAGPLIIITGLAFIAGGVFVPDPSLGFPPGSIAGVPATMSWHSIIHAFAPIIGFLSLVIALIIIGRRFGAAGQQGWKWLTIIIALATFALSALPNFTADMQKAIFNFIPLWAGATLGFIYTSIVIAKLKNAWLRQPAI